MSLEFSKLSVRYYLSVQRSIRLISANIDWFHSPLIRRKSTVTKSKLSLAHTKIQSQPKSNCTETKARHQHRLSINEPCVCVHCDLISYRLWLAVSRLLIKIISTRSFIFFPQSLGNRFSAWIMPVLIASLSGNAQPIQLVLSRLATVVSKCGVCRDLEETVLSLTFCGDQLVLIENFWLPQEYDFSMYNQ